MKKASKYFCIIVCLLSILTPSTCFAQNIKSETPQTNSVNLTITSTDEEITPYRDVIVWRYKAINNKIHKRKYNTSKNVWVGPWIPC